MITKRARLWLSRGVAAFVLVVLVVLAASAWWYAGRIRDLLADAYSPAGLRDQVVVAIDRDSVRLPLDRVTGLPGTWGLDFPGGYAELGDVISVGDGVVTRQIRRITGSVTPGTSVAFDRMAFAPDPASRRVPFEEVLVPGPLGDYAAWLGEGTSDTWVIFVHDRGADRREALRVLPTVALLGFPTLVITYRGDIGAPGGSGGLGLGGSEWPDLQAAVEFAVSAGAADVVLMGYGVGGSIVGLFMRESRFAERVSAIVLDAPLIDATDLVERSAVADNVPGFMLQWSKAVATLRYGVDWSDLDLMVDAGTAAVATLVFHGEEDSLYPVSVSQAYADAAPQWIELIVVPSAGHGEAWNVDPDAYEGEIARFLREVTSAGAPAADTSG